MQKSQLCAAGALMLVVGIAMGVRGPLMAQNNPPGPPPAPNGAPRPPRLDGPALDDLTRALELSPQQQQKIKAILDASQQQIYAALTPEQRQRLQELQSHRGPGDPRREMAPTGNFGTQTAPIPRPANPTSADPMVTRVPVVFAGGTETDPRDRGRPVVLIAGALGVAPQAFRDAFRGVHPAGPDRGPTGDEARANKAVLLAALGRYGITNERLDEVSNRYRYMASRGQMWPHEPALAYALVKNGKITGFEVVQPGSGYSSTPTLTVPGFDASAARVQLAYGPDFERNGSIASIMLSGLTAR